MTTDTTHHRYFVWKLNERFPLQGIFLEEQPIAPSFDTFHRFEKSRDEYERDILLSGLNSTFSDFANTHSYESINSAECISYLRTLSPDIIVVFGTRKLLPEVIKCASLACINLHGGNPEEYRGLDTHLWAIYHGDFANLITTLHYVDLGLDNGDIIFQTELKLSKDNKLHQLRSINTKACVDLTGLAFSSLLTTGQLPSRKQLYQGRYYSFMPSVLKETCVNKFDRYVSGL